MNQPQQTQEVLQMCQWLFSRLFIVCRPKKFRQANKAQIIIVTLKQLPEMKSTSKLRLIKWLVLNNICSKVSFPVADEPVMSQSGTFYFQVLFKCFQQTLLSFLFAIVYCGV